MVMQEQGTGMNDAALKMLETAQGEGRLETAEHALAGLEEDPENARLHGEKNMNAIKASLREFGQVEPLVVQRSRMRVIGGNGRLRAMREMGWANAKVVLLDIDDARAKALGVALNRTGELAEWDYDRLESLVRSVADADLSMIGFDKEELDALLTSNPWEGIADEAIKAGERVQPPAAEYTIKVTNQGDEDAVWHSLLAWAAEMGDKVTVTR